MKKLIVSILVLASLTLSAPSTVLADNANEECVTVYGQGVVCGQATPPFEHKPEQTGIEDLANPVNLSIISFLSAGVLFAYSKKRKLA